MVWSKNSNKRVVLPVCCLTDVAKCREREREEEGWRKIKKRKNGERGREGGVERESKREDGDR